MGTTHRHRTGIAWMLLGWMLVLTAPAVAAVETDNPDAHIRFPLEAVPSVFTEEGEFSLFAWVRPSGEQPEEAAIFQIPGILEIWLDAGAGVSAAVHAEGLPPLVATTGQAYASDEWMLVAVSWQPFFGTLAVSAVSESTPLASGSDFAAEYVNATPGPADAGPIIGSYLFGKPAMLGVTGLIALRDHDIDPADVEDVWMQQRYLAPYDRKNNLAGGKMTGPDGCLWMLNHSMTTDPIELIDGKKSEHAAVVGEPVGLRNVAVYIKPPEGLDKWDVIPFVLFSTEGFVYRSHREPEFGGFFVQDFPFFEADLSPSPGVSPLARQIADGPTQPIRVMVSANSRGVQRDDGSGESNGNYAGGMVELHRANVAGVLLRPAEFTVSVNLGRPWFGFDIDMEDKVYTNSPSGITEVHFPGPMNPWHGFSRCFTTSTSNNALGPGAGLHLDPGTEYALRCRPEPGSLVVAEAPLVVEAYVLRFPGSGDVSWAPSFADDQASKGLSGEFEVTELDTTVTEFTIGPNDEINGGVITIESNIADLINPGDACFVSAGPGFGAVTEVISATPLMNGGTRILISHPFHLQVGEGSHIKVGPWGFASLRHEFGPVDPDDPNNWRGLRVDAVNDGLGGVIVCAFSGWRPDVPGLLVGAAGAGGTGYTPQIIKTFPSAFGKWMSLTEADVWIVAPAQQQSTPSSILDFTELVGIALPETEIVWAGESVHSGNLVGNNQEPWHTFIVQEAAENNVVGFTAATDERLGDFRAHLTDGLRKDSEHYSGRGARIIAEVWTELLSTSALVSIADCNNDGALDVLDFICFQGAFLSGDPAADLNGDGELNALDFVAFQQAFLAG